MCIRDSIGTAIHYPLPLHLQKALAHMGHKPGDFPHTERACQQALALPLFPELTTEQVDYVCDSLYEIIGRS